MIIVPIPNAMNNFSVIMEKARERHGSVAELESLLPEAKSLKQLKACDNAYYLSNMSRRIFRAGLKHSMVDAKWPAFEEVFYQFDIEQIRNMSDEQLEKLLEDKRIIRHWGKIKSVRANAQAMSELDKEMGRYLGDWPVESIVELWEDLKKRFKQLGGMSGPYFLRMVGKDTFLFTQDVLKALHYWGIYQGEGKTKKDRQQIQAAF